MDNGSQEAAGPFALAYAAGALLLSGYAVWHYLMGNYGHILFPALLALLVLIAAVLRLTGVTRPGVPACLVLIAGYVIIASELPRQEEAAALWASLAPFLTLLLLPLGSAILLNLVMVPVWLFLLESDQVTGELMLGYLAIMVIAPLAPWEQRRQQALLLATDPRDPHCNALSHEGLHDHLISEFERTELLHQPLAILMIHLPQLEMASEQFGSRARQALLDTLCQEVAHCSRRHDFLGRQDTATFWLVLPDTSESGAQLVQQRIMESVERAVLVDTGPLRTRMCLCQRQPGEVWAHFGQRLLTLTRRLEDR